MSQTPLNLQAFRSGSDHSSIFEKELASVSRSFYLTIQALPEAIRRPIGLGYLLARASDTIADSTSASSVLALSVLTRYGAAIKGELAEEFLLTQNELNLLQSGIQDPAEKHLLERLGMLLELLSFTDEETRSEISWVMGEILRGQMLDVEHFNNISGPISALKSSDDLEEYIYLVAGSVGAFWTRVCYRLVPGYSKIPLEELTKRGISFGKGLQLVNILRDFPKDVMSGRCYLPSEELGFNPLLLMDHRMAAEVCYSSWLQKAEEYLEEGFQYIQALRPVRLRFACFLPWAIGVKKRALLKKKSPHPHDNRVKVTRNEVKRVKFWGLLAAVSHKGLGWCKKRWKQGE